MKNNELTHLNKLKARTEEMYETSGPVSAGAYFSEVKELLFEAGNLAKKMGLEDEVRAINKRLDHIRKVYESQMR